MKILNKVKNFLIEYFDLMWYMLSTSSHSFKEDLQNKSIFYMLFNFYAMLFIHVFVIGLSTVFVILVIDLFIRYTMTCIILLCIFFAPALLFWWLKKSMK
jgi:uncharacterized membrane protein YqjE